MKNVPFPLAAAARYVNVKFATQQKKIMIPFREFYTKYISEIDFF